MAVVCYFGYNLSRLFTKEVALSLGIGLADTAIKIVAYYAHERLWDRMDFGRRKEIKKDYMI